MSHHLRCDVCRKYIYRHQELVSIGFEYQTDLDHVLTVHGGLCQKTALEVLAEAVRSRAPTAKERPASD